MKELFIDADGIRLHLRDWGGEGPPILLLHGMGANAHWWDAVAPLLQGLRPLALDLRGHGDSGWAQDYGVEVFAADVERVRRALELEDFFLAGHSMGGRVAMACAAGRLRGLRAVAALDFLCEVPERSRARYERARGRGQPSYASRGEIEARFRFQPPGTRLSAEGTLALASRCVRQTSDGRWTWKFDWKAFRGGYSPVWPLLERVEAPALIMRGEHSTVMPREHLERLALGLRGPGIEVPGAYHHLILDEPEVCARHLSGFFAFPS